MELTPVRKISHRTSRIEEERSKLLRWLAKRKGKSRVGARDDVRVGKK